MAQKGSPEHTEENLQAAANHHHTAKSDFGEAQKGNAWKGRIPG
jgi:hypothetical protein